MEAVAEAGRGGLQGGSAAGRSCERGGTEAAGGFRCCGGCSGSSGGEGSLRARVGGEGRGAGVLGGEKAEEWCEGKGELLGERRKKRKVKCHLRSLLRNTINISIRIALINKLSLISILMA